MKFFFSVHHLNEDCFCTHCLSDISIKCNPRCWYQENIVSQTIHPAIHPVKRFKITDHQNAHWGPHDCIHRTRWSPAKTAVYLNYTGFISRMHYMNSCCSSVYAYVILSTMNQEVIIGDDTFSHSKITYIRTSFQLTLYFESEVLLNQLYTSHLAGKTLHPSYKDQLVNAV
jgi:hypothetical protein